jgi:DNA-binding LytR/AlgR family response regulator
MHKKYWVALSSIEELDSKFIIALFEYFADFECFGYFEDFE